MKKVILYALINTMPAALFPLITHADDFVIPAGQSYTNFTGAPVYCSSSNSTPANSIQATFQCDQFGTMTVTAVNLNTGASSSYAAQDADCSNDVSLLSAKLAKPFASGKLVEWCDQYWNLYKVVINASGQVALVSNLHDTQCPTDATANNNAI